MKTIFKIKIIKISLLILLICGTDLKAEDQNITLVRAFPKLQFKQAIDFQSFNDQKIFIAERKGFIKSFINKNDSTSSNIFLDISSKVKTSGSEQGLLGFTFHPNFTKNGFLYTNYTRKKDGATIISRFTYNKEKTEIDIRTEVVILKVKQPYGNHNAGQIAFGPDGYLYIGLGDGGYAGDPHNHGQNLKTLLGSILRIDVNKSSLDKNYSIPKDNPYIDNQNAYKEEIYAYGLRNPWRFSFDSLTGKLWLADVGQGKIEEVNIISKGGNYGWKIMEGSKIYKCDNCNTDMLIKPITEYSHKLGKSITGGYVYRGKNSYLNGYYIFGDYVSGRIWAHKEKTKLLIDSDLMISTFGLANNNIYILDYVSGKVYTFNNS